MKIWILSSETPHYWAGGIARYVDNFSRIAGASGHEITVISRGESNKCTLVSEGYELREFVHNYANGTSPIKGIKPDEHPGWPFNNMSYFAALSFQYAEYVTELIRDQGPPDIIECQDYAAIGYFLMQRKLCGQKELLDVPIVTHLHTPDFMVQKFNQYPRFKLPDYWIGRMERASIHMADAILAPSQFIADEISKTLEGDIGDIDVIPYPVPEVGDLSSDDREDELLVYPGRIELRKGVEQLLAACEKLWIGEKKFRLEMVGGDVDTPLKGGSLQAYFEKKYSHRVDDGSLVFHGSQPHQKCLEIMRRATAVVVPSLWENFPNTCIEAMLQSKVVIASNSGGQAEMVRHGNNCGFVFRHEADGELEETIKHVLGLSSSELSQIGHSAQQAILEKCQPEGVLSARIKHYEKVIANTQRRKRYPFSNAKLRNSIPAEPLSENPLVSVVVPFYNLGEYLEDCIGSILASEEVNFEIVIINDGSNDPNSLEVLEKLRAQSDSRIRILDIRNQGLANARNTGAAHARGELVAFVDADDMVGPEFLRKAVAVLKSYENVHLVYSWVRFFGDSVGAWHSWTFDMPYMLCHNTLVPLVVVRKDSFLKAGKNKAHIVYGLEDYEGWISMAEAGYGGVAIPELLVQYRVRENSMFKVIDQDKKLYLYDLILAEHPELYQEYGVEIFGLQSANGPAHNWNQPTGFRSPYDKLVTELHGLREANAWLTQKKNELMEERDKLKSAEDWLKADREKLLNKLAPDMGN